LDFKLGDAIKPWKEALSLHDGNTVVSAMRLLGTVRSVTDAVEARHLVSFTDLVMAEAF
jgi:hypothetical protein